MYGRCKSRKHKENTLWAVLVLRKESMKSGQIKHKEFLLVFRGLGDLLAELKAGEIRFTVVRDKEQCE